VNTARLALGTYTGNIVVSAQGAANSPLSVPLTFNFIRSGLPAGPSPGVAPATISAGSGDTVITVNGSNFRSGATVQVNGVSIATSYVNSGLLTAIIPASMLANPGQLTITVVNPGQSAPVLSTTLFVNAVTPVIANGGVVNAASLLGGPVSAGELVVINGDNLGPTDTVQATAATGFYPTTLGGVVVTFDSTSAALISAGVHQIVAIVPFELNGQHATQLQIQLNGQKSTPVTLQVAGTAPGLFVADGTGLGEANAVNEDGTANGSTDPATAGTLVTFLATGAGQTNPSGVDGLVTFDPAPQLLQPASVQIGGEDCTEVTAAPVVGMVSGIVQVTARVPADLSGTVGVVLSIGGNVSQPGVTLVVEPSDAMPATTSRPRPLRRVGR
jgi:uncharacterized protein (TIGR03437 family)